MRTWLCAVCSIFSVIDLTLGKGQIALDSHNFDKILSKFHTTLVKVDVAFPFGPKHEAFLQVAESSAHRPDFLVAEVGVKDYGDHDNEDLVKRFKLKSEQFPVYLLFVQGRKEPYSYLGSSDDDYSADKVINFVRSKDTGIWIGAPGCLQDFDKLAKEFVRSQCPHQRKGLLKDAEYMWDGVQTNSARKSAEVYVKTMRKLVQISKDSATGDNIPKDHKEKAKEKSAQSAQSMAEFLSREKSRVRGLLNEKMSDMKRDELKYRLNILDSFALYLSSGAGEVGKDEL